VIRPARLVALAAALVWAAPASAEHLTVALSTGEVKISSNFTGAPVTLFGVIERDAQSASRPGGYQVATLVQGPPESVIVRRKDRILGVWANSASETILAPPSFYMINSSGKIADLAPAPTLERHRLGFANTRFDYRNRPRANDPRAAEFREAFLRIKENAGLYTENEDAIEFIGDSVFRTTVWVPANSPVGFYRVSVFLFADGALLTRTDQSFRISKSGFEQYISVFAREKSFVYGFLCALMALFTGWLGGVIFRRD
jgi:uncharacterized protein (TIGR02186 family)